MQDFPAGMMKKFRCEGKKETSFLNYVSVKM
jgi:hypothetical protein